ncbi:hypothetical protein L9F63_015214, partial [Diploptera punctata]
TAVSATIVTIISCFHDCQFFLLPKYENKRDKFDTLIFFKSSQISSYHLILGLPTALVPTKPRIIQPPPLVSYWDACCHVLHKKWMKNGIQQVQFVTNRRSVKGTQISPQE